DWHWADSASLDLLHYAAVRWAEENAPIMVVLTLRQEALIESPDLQSWLTKLNHTTAPVPLQLSELSQTETEQLVQTLLEPKTGSTDAPMTQFSDWLFAETGGQPLFLTETLKALAEDGLVQPDTTSSRSAGSGQASWHIDWAKFELQMQRSDRHISPGVQQIIKGWLAHLTTIAAKLLSAAAVLAKETTFERLCSVAGLEEFEALTALDELLGKQLLEEREKSQSVSREPLYRFSHQKVGEVVYAEAGTARRRILHRRAFEMLKTGAVPAADLAHHALNAGLLSETIHYSLIAGNEAMALFAFRVAIVHFETVWQIAEQDGWPETISGADRQAFYVSMGRAYELDEGWPQAKKIYEAMIGVAQTMGATAMECLGLNHLATVYIFGLRDQQPAIPLLEQARTVAEKNNDGRGLAETEDNLSLLALMNGDVYGVLHHGEKALNLARQLGHPQLIARCLNRLARVQFPLRRWEIEEAYASESLQYYAITGNLVLAADSQRVLGISQIFSGRLREGLDTLQETFAFSEQIENLWGEADCGWMLALAFVEVGEYGQAIRHAQTAVEKSKKVGIPHMISISLTSWGIVQRTVMALDASREAQTAGLEIYNHRGMPTMPTIMDWISGELCALCALGGDWTQAHSYARQTLGLRVEASLPPFGFTGWYETEALLRGGDGDLARAEVERLAGIVGSNKRYQLPLLRSQAVLAQWDGDAEQAISHLQAALALAQEIGLPGEEWPILGALGGLYGEQGEDVKAREAYGEAAVIIHRLAETIDDEALRVGYLTAVPVQSILEVSEVF
ncbi:MAG: hypothetical protein ACE5FD_05615, partial [Anaerolineae bacterium]